LKPKEGLALINGTQMMTAVLTEAFLKAAEAALAADVIGALSLDALLGTDRAFDARLQRARGQKGQVEVAARLRDLLKDSQLKQSHELCDRVQDAYSLRCMPQVHGAARDFMRFVGEMLERELNAVTDNPLVFKDDIVSGGNFHGEPIAMAADTLKIAVAELASISERRIEQLVNPDLSRLPAFLVDKGGLNSGYMMAQVTAAALVSENKVLAHPASVDSIPTSANQEDHVSMGPIAARQVLAMAENLEQVLAIELLCACQALDFRRPLKSSRALEKLRRDFRKEVPMLKRDRQLSKDVARARHYIACGRIREILQIPSLF
jgi:histidine ammonia-lyase